MSRTVGGSPTDPGNDSQRNEKLQLGMITGLRLIKTVWGPVVQWLVQRFRSERLRVRSRRSATFTPSAHVRRQSLPVWPPTLNKIHLPFYLDVGK